MSKEKDVVRTGKGIMDRIGNSNEMTYDPNFTMKDFEKIWKEAMVQANKPRQYQQPIQVLEFYSDKEFIALHKRPDPNTIYIGGMKAHKAYEARYKRLNIKD